MKENKKGYYFVRGGFLSFNHGLVKKEDDSNQSEEEPGFFMSCDDVAGEEVKGKKMKDVLISET